MSVKRDLLLVQEPSLDVLLGIAQLSSSQRLLTQPNKHCLNTTREGTDRHPYKAPDTFAVHTVLGARVHTSPTDRYVLLVGAKDAIWKLNPSSVSQLRDLCIADVAVWGVVL